jgi:hypothetical protein
VSATVNWLHHDSLKAEHAQPCSFLHCLSVLMHPSPQGLRRRHRWKRWGRVRELVPAAEGADGDARLDGEILDRDEFPPGRPLPSIIFTNSSQLGPRASFIMR